MSVSAPDASAADSLISRFIGKPARICPVCGGKRFRLNMAGATLCIVCKPSDAAYPELIAEFAGKPPRCVWGVPNDEFDSPIVPADRTREIGNSGLGVDGSGGGAGLGDGFAAGTSAGAAGQAGLRDGWGDPESRPDPDNGPSELLIVSTRLEFARARLGGYWEQEMAEVACLPSPGVQDAVQGVWRRLTQPYFAWLVSQVLKMNFSGNYDQRNAEAMRLLREIAMEAVQVGEFGLWALDQRQWPWAPPAGFDPPEAIGRRVVWDWGRGVSGASLDQMVVFEPGVPGGKGSKNGNGGNIRSGGGDNARTANRGSSVGIRRDGLFADDCPD